MLVRINSVLGNSRDPAYEEILHRLRHEGRAEYVTIGESDLARRRLRVHTDKGTECAIALPRSKRLEHGALLELSERRAIVVELQELPWLMLEARDSAAALELGFLAGHHHWRVKFSGARMNVALDDSLESYLARLRAHIADGSVRVVEESDE